MKKLKVLLSNFSDDNNLSDSVSIIYNEYKNERKINNEGLSIEIFENKEVINNDRLSTNSLSQGNTVVVNPQLKVISDRLSDQGFESSVLRASPRLSIEIIDKLSDENLLNDLSNEEIKIQNNNDKVLNIMDKVSNSYLKIYKLLENNNKVLNDLLENINSENIKISVKQQKLVDITKAVISTILIILNSKYEDENLFTIFENKYKVKKGYDLLYCKKGKNIPLYYVNSYRLRFSNQGLGKIVPYDKNLEFKNEYYIGGKFIEAKSNEEMKHELKKAIKRINRLQDYFNTQYTIAASIYNNLRILYD